jgi:O-6-methylguanine DNA methyltransferase
MSCLYYTIYPWELSDLYIAATERGLVRIDFSRNKTEQEFMASFVNRCEIIKKPVFFITLINKLNSYFAGVKTDFNIPLDLQGGTDFQRQVWEIVKQIPYGTSRTYGQIAAEINNPMAVRAVGAANGANPLPIVIPCHRVVRTGGKLGGYGGGLDIKDKLLQLERIVL